MPSSKGMSLALYRDNSLTLQSQISLFDRYWPISDALADALANAAFFLQSNIVLSLNGPSQSVSPCFISSCISYCCVRMDWICVGY